VGVEATHVPPFLATLDSGDVETTSPSGGEGPDAGRDDGGDDAARESAVGERTDACARTTCSAEGKNCGVLNDGCGGTIPCGSCAAPDKCGGGGTPNVCGSPCSFEIKGNSYNGPKWLGTVVVKNNGPASSSNYSVAFDIPSGRHCWNDYVPPGATLSPLNGTAASTGTVSNHCVFTWSMATPIAPGASFTFNYTADTTSNFDAKSSTVVHDALCAP
jgi:hypothetical protein